MIILWAFIGHLHDIHGRVFHHDNRELRFVVESSMVEETKIMVKLFL